MMTGNGHDLDFFSADKTVATITLPLSLDN